MGKKQKESDEGKSKLELMFEKLNKAYGKGTIMSLGEKIRDEYDIIPTGSIGFDYKTLGVGGFVKGKLYELIGWESVGKSTVCAHAVAECQKAGGLALYIDSEHAVDPNYFKALGVDIDHLIISQPMNGDEGFNVAMEAIKSGEIDLVVIDSDSSMLPKAVIDGEVGDSAIGKKAKLNSDAYPKLKTTLVNNNVCVIVISQYREKIGVMFGDPRTTQGGHALKYYADCRIEMSRSLIKEGDMITGNKTTIKTLKNKTFPPYRKCDFTVVFGKGIDKIEELATLAMDYDIIVKSGGWYSYGDTKLREDELYQLLEDNPELFDEIREKIIEKIKMS